ncbi:TPA: GNAT family N-acetyltransferase [Streptococcus pneumoniae]|nr:GNAT family N-acetyltransferase [Streptococcus pneumoniae]
MTIELRDVTMENYFDVLNLDVKEYQKQFIATNAISLAEVYVYTKNGDFVAPLAVYDNDVIIGFVMIAYDKKIVISSGNYLLFRFMIDKNFQNQGYFKPIMDKVLDYVRTAPAGLSNKLWLSYEPENEQARFCYLSYGFKETGEISENEVVAIYDLTIEK